MEKTLAQRIAELSFRARQLRALRDTGMQCQDSLDQVLTDRDRLVEQEKKSTNRFAGNK